MLLLKSGGGEMIRYGYHSTQRLIIRPLEKEDYHTWYDAHVKGLPQQNKWDMGPKEENVCRKIDFNRFKARLEQLAKKDDYYRYYLFKKRTKDIIGHIDFDIYARNSQQFSNFGYQIYNRYWRQGYGKEAAQKGLEIGFQDLKLNRLEAAINLDNEISIRLAKSIGMKKEGIKKRYWYEHGEWTDQIIYVANPEDIGRVARKP